jgi:hypothetical protein
LVDHPYIEIHESGSTYRRVFSENSDENSLKWHWDEEDRTLEFLTPNDWLFQIDNQLPVECKGKIKIKAGVWHRLIKGNSKLEVIVTKYFPE